MNLLYKVLFACQTIGVLYLVRKYHRKDYITAFVIEIDNGYHCVEEEEWRVRELVGSIHKHMNGNEDYRIHVEGRMRQAFKNEMRLWENVSSSVQYGKKVIKLKTDKKLSSANLDMVVENVVDQDFCHLKLRKTSFYEFDSWYSQSERISQNSPFDAKVCIGIPIKSRKKETFEEIPLINVFLKSFIKSVTPREWKKFDIVIYLGFDEEDELFDKRNSEFDQMLGHFIGDYPLRVKYQRIPQSKWLSFIWNRLFVDAMKDECDYFYQTGDDAEIVGEAGWISAFAETLKMNSGLGVVGPFDLKWECDLLTQAMVSRRHWEIFGWLYPVEIRDWYTDDWISEIYGLKSTFCDDRFKVKNESNGPQRYRPCESPPWREAVARDGKKVEKFKSDHL